MGPRATPQHGHRDRTIRVPLILRGVGIEPGVVIADAVSHVDIVPTVLDIVDLPLDEGLQGTDLREGGSEQSYSEAMTGMFSLGLAPLKGYTDAEGRLVEGSWPGWYPLTRGRIPTEALTVADLQERTNRLHLLQEKLGDNLAPSVTLPPEDLAALQALGYVGGDIHAEAGEIDPRDVIQVLPLTWRVRSLMADQDYEQAEEMLSVLETRLPDTFGVALLRAQLLLAQGEHESALQHFLDLYLRSPSGTTSLHLARIHAASGNWTEASSWFESTLEHNPADPNAMAGLVRCALAQGDNNTGEFLAEKYLSQYPDHAELMLMYALVKAEQGAADESLATARWALGRMPVSPWAQATSARILWLAGEAEAAIDALLESLRLAPYEFGLRQRLVEMLLEQQRAAEAGRILAPALRSMPHDPELQALQSIVQTQLSEQQRAPRREDAAALGRE